MENRNNKLGITMEGGASRTIFSCGVTDCFLEHNIMPDHFVGVSAGELAAQVVDVAVRLPQEGQGDGIFSLHEFVGISFGSDKHKGHGFVPKESQSAP